MGRWIWEGSLLQRLLLMAFWRNVANGVADTDPGPLRDVRPAGRGMETDLVKHYITVFTVKGMCVQCGKLKTIAKQKYKGPPSPPKLPLLPNTTLVSILANVPTDLISYK